MPGTSATESLVDDVHLVAAGEEEGRPTRLAVGFGEKILRGVLVQGLPSEFVF